MGFWSKLRNVPDLLDDPRVEWEVFDRTSPIGTSGWHWLVIVDGTSESESGPNWLHSKEQAIEDARGAARRLLTGGERIGKYRPCAICSNPAPLGKETDTDECAALLAAARAELSRDTL